MKNNAQPKNSAELEEYLGDISNIKADLDSGQFAHVITNYIKVEREEVSAQVKEQIQMVQADLAKQGLSAKSPVNYANRNQKAPVVYNQSAPGANLDGEFSNFAEYCQALSTGHRNFRNQKGLDGKLDKVRSITNSFGSEVPDAGGFLVPEEFRGDLLQIALENSVVRPRATVIPMSTLRTYIPSVDDTSHVSSVFGGIIAYWTEEAAALTESQASFGRVALDAKKLTIYCEVPNELLADAQALNGWMSSQLPKALAWNEDLAFFTGTGTGEPQGFISCPASVQVAKQTNQAAATIVWENLVNMYARMLPQALPNAVWVASIDTFPQLATMALSVGTGGGPVWMGNYTNPGTNTPPVSILGRPVYFTEKAPKLGSTGDISFVDLSYYLIGDRQAMQMDSSPHYKFANDKTAFRLIERVDGRPWLTSAITPQNNSTATLTPFVQIAAR